MDIKEFEELMLRYDKKQDKKCIDTDVILAAVNSQDLG